MFSIQRSNENPILSPDSETAFEAAAVFNPCPIKYGGKTYILYRALSRPELMSGNHMRVSSIGIAESKDGVHLSERRQLIAPEEEWEKFGCEDPRVTKIGNTYYIFYTALSNYPFTADGIKAAVAVTKNFKKIEYRKLVTPFNAKAMALFPEKIGCKYAALLTVNTDKPPSSLCYAQFNQIEDMFSNDYWQKWYGDFQKCALSLRRNQDEQVELGAPPLKTKFGWLVIYSHISQYYDHGRAFGVEAKGVFNPAAIEIKNDIHILYRAVGDNHVSTFFYARSKDGFSIEERSGEPVYAPRAEFEQRADIGSSGCEDPRLTLIDGKIYLLYTAYDGRVPRGAVSSISIKDFEKKRWLWSEPEVITPNNIPDKDACILPEKINGKYVIIHRVETSICMDTLSTLDFKNEKVNKCVEILTPRPGMWDGAKVGLAAPPVLTKSGWIMFYHGVSKTTHYRIGAALLDANDPSRVLARSCVPIFEPVEDYERIGIVNDVVFPCGIVNRKGILYIYYGAADKVTGVATASVKGILKTFEYLPWINQR